MSDALSPGASIGILGGGQLGRMLAVAASRLGFRTHVFEPAPDCPAAQVASACTTAAWEDVEALTAFAGNVDVITYEFENIPTAALDVLDALRPVRPGRRVLAISQDRVAEKTFLNDLGIATAPWAAVESEADLAAVFDAIGAPAILKTRRFGYDGKGQVRLEGPRPGAFDSLAAPCVLEGFVEFTSEISVIVARGLDGVVVAYDPGRNEHDDGILRQTTVPSGLPERVVTDAVILAGRIVNALDYVGVLGVELFVTPEGLLVNEIAPRVHNSGHWTQGGCAVDQFEQHIRAVAGLPLGDGGRHADVVMRNLIGDDMNDVPALLAEAGAQLHLYGKAETRPGRKMGHVNRIARRS